MFAWVRSDPNAVPLDRGRAGNELREGDEHEQEQHAEVQEDHLDRDRGEVDERGALAAALGDREEQHALPDVDDGVEKHQERADEQHGRVRGERREEVRRADDGAHQSEADAVDEEPGEEERPEEPRVPLARPLRVLDRQVGFTSRVAELSVGCHVISLSVERGLGRTAAGGSVGRRADASHGDRDLSLGMARPDVVHRLRRVAQWIGAIQDGRDLAGLDQVLEDDEICMVRGDEEPPQSLAAEAEQHGRPHEPAGAGEPPIAEVARRSG